MARAKITLEQLEQLASQAEQLHAEPGRVALRAALEARDAPLVALAAKLIQTHEVRGLEETLVHAYRALTGAKGSASDPGCLAKEALLATLDAADYFDAGLFAEAARYTQPERGKTTRDSGGRVRARGVLGLARLGHVDLLPIFGGSLADADPQVRYATASAIAHRGQREAAGLLLLKLGVGDAESGVVIECLRALFTLAPDLAVPAAERLLEQGDDATRALTLQALGTAADDGALRLLQDRLARCLLAHERAPLIEALGLSVRPAARAALFGLIEDGSQADALVALGVLSIHRYDSKLVAQLRVLVEATGSPVLRAAFARELEG